MKFQGSCEGTSDGTPWCFCSCVEYVVKSAESAGFVTHFPILSWYVWRALLMACLCACLVHHPVFFWLIVRPKCKRLRTCPFESPSWCDQGCVMCGNSSPVVTGLTLVLALDLEKRMSKRCPSDLEQRYTPSVVDLKACLNQILKKYISFDSTFY